MKIRKSRVAWATIAVLIFSLVSPGQVVFSTNSNNTGPALAFDDTNDRYLMVYTDDAGGGENEILGQVLNSNGSAQGDTFVISNDSGPNTGAPDIVFDDDNDRFVVVWQDDSGSRNQIYASIIDEDFTVIEDDFILDGSSDHQVTPGIARNPNNDTFLVMWLEGDSASDTEKSLNGAYVDESDLSVESIDLSQKNNALSYDLTYDASNDQYVIIWDAQHSKTRTRLNTDFIDNTGDEEKGTSYISPGDGEVAAPSIAYSESAGANLVVWIDEDDDIDDVYSQYATTSGSAIYVFSAEEGVDITDVTLVSSGGSDELLMVWSEFDGEEYSVIGNYINDDGTSTGAENIVISAGSSEPVDTIIAFNPNDDNFLVMQDDGSGPPEPPEGGGGVIGEDFGQFEFRTTISAVEEIGSVDIIVDRDGGTYGDVTIDYQTVNGTADGSDFISTSGTLSFADGVSEKTISVPITVDVLFEVDEYFDVVISNPSGGATLGSPSTHTVTIQDDDHPGEIEFRTSSSTVDETGIVSVIVDRSRGTRGTVSIDYQTVNGSAGSGDYISTSGTLSFADDVSQKTVSIPIIEDSSDEINESFNVELSNPGGGAILGSPVTHTVTIEDNDAPHGEFNFSVATDSTIEGGEVNLIIERNLGQNGDVTVQYATNALTASTGDFTPNSGTLDFLDGESSKTVTIQTTEDVETENDETFEVVLSSPTSGATVGSINTTTVTILDDDQLTDAIEFSTDAMTVTEGSTATLTVKRSGTLSGSASVSYATNSGSANGTDFTDTSGTLTFADGENSKTIEIQTTDDSSIESSEKFTVTLSNPTVPAYLGSITSTEVTISDNDSEFNLTSVSETVVEGQIVNLTVERTGSFSGTSSVDYDFVADSAGTSDYTDSSGTLTFSDGETSESIVVQTTDDGDVEDTETFRVVLSNATNGSVGSGSSAEITLIDNDVYIDILDFASTSLTLTEGDSFDVTVIRSGELQGAIGVDYTVASDTADASDYIISEGSLSFADGVSEKTFSIIIIDDSALEDTETFTLELSNAVGNAVIGTIDTMSVSISDNDSELEFSTSSRVISEGESTVVQVERSGVLEETVTVDYMLVGDSANTDDYIDDTGTLTFLAGENTKEITVQTTDDGITENTETFSLVLSNPQGNAVIGTVDTVAFFIADNDDILTTLIFSTSAFNITEGDSKTIPVRRTGNLIGTVTVDYATVTGTAGSSDFTEISGTLSFANGVNEETIMIQTTEDQLIENSENFSVELSNPSETAYLGTIDSADMTISDDDSEFNYSMATETVIEGRSIDFTIEKTGDLSSTSTVDYEVVAGSAGTSDYIDVSGTLIFTDGDSTKTITVQTTDDEDIEEVEVFSVTISNPVGETVIGPTSSVDVTLVDNDVRLDNFNFTSTASALLEGESTDLTVLRSGELTGDVTVDYAVTAGSAESADYVLTEGTLEFSDGEAEKMINVEIVDDTILEDTETITLELDNPGGNAVVGLIDTMEISIADNDVELELSTGSKSISEGDDTTIQVERNGYLETVVSVDYTIVSGSADDDDYVEVSGTLTFQAGETVKSIEVETTEDKDTEETETFSIVLSNPQGNTVIGSEDTTEISIVDDDELQSTFNFSSSSQSVVEGENKTFTVVRSGSLDGAVSVEYVIESGTAGTSDFVQTSGTIVFDDGERTETVTVVTIEDQTEENTEKFSISLSNPSVGSELGSIDEVQVVILDDDEVEDAFNFSVGSTTVAEGDDVTLEIVRVGDLEEPATVDYILSSGTAESDDFSGTIGTVTFDEGEDTSTILVEASIDQETEEEEYFYVLLYNPSDDMVVGELATVIVVIENRAYVPPKQDKKDKKEEQDTADPQIDELESTKVVNELADVLKGKAASDEEISVQTIDAYYSHIDQTLGDIQDEALLKNAVDSYIDTIGVLSSVAGEDVDAKWLESELVDRINIFTDATSRIENHEDLTEALFEVIEDIQSTNDIESGSELDEAVENMVDVTMNDIGTMKDNFSVGIVDGEYEVSFDVDLMNTQLQEELEAFNALNDTVSEYYGDDNVRDFEFTATLEVPKVNDHIVVELDEETLSVAKELKTTSLGVKVEGTTIDIDNDMYQSDHIGEDGQEESNNIVLDLTFKQDDPEEPIEGIEHDEGYVLDVKVYVNGEEKDRFEKPVKLSFELSDFDFGDVEEYNPDKVSVFRFDEETGQWEPVGGFYDPFTDSITVFRQNMSQYTVMQSNKSFADVEDSYAKAEIEELLGKGIIDETASFDPESHITREEMATWVARSYGLEDKDGTMPFEDVPSDSENYEELAAAYSAGIFSGTSENTFNPDGVVTKEEMSVMLANAMTQFDQKHINESLGGELASLSDGGDIETWATDEMALLNELGFIGEEAGQINPNEAITKEMAAAMIKKISG